MILLTLVILSYAIVLISTIKSDKIVLLDLSFPFIVSKLFSIVLINYFSTISSIFLVDILAYSLWISLSILFTCTLTFNITSSFKMLFAKVNTYFPPFFGGFLSLSFFPSPSTSNLNYVNFSNLSVNDSVIVA